MSVLSVVCRAVVYFKGRYRYRYGCCAGRRVRRKFCRTAVSDTRLGLGLPSPPTIENDRELDGAATAADNHVGHGHAHFLGTAYATAMAS